MYNRSPVENEIDETQLNGLLKILEEIWKKADSNSFFNLDFPSAYSSQVRHGPK
jgi:hypothetical protein